MSPTMEQIRTVPKVLLHDHLDGGLRPATMIELAAECGYGGLPAQDPDELTKILTAGAHRGHLNLYLDAFRHTVGVMQTPGGCAAWRANAPRTWPRTGSSTRRCGSLPSCTPSSACRSTRWSRPC